MVLLMPLSESKFSTRVALVSFVQHSCRSCSTHVALVSHSSCSCLTRVALVLHLCCSCHAPVARVWHSCCKLDQIKIKRVILISWEKGKCYLFRFCCYVLLIDFFKLRHMLLCNLIKLVNILRQSAASEQKRF